MHVRRKRELWTVQSSGNTLVSEGLSMSKVHWIFEGLFIGRMHVIIIIVEDIYKAPTLWLKALKNTD